jgi:hypothetical protein
MTRTFRSVAAVAVAVSLATLLTACFSTAPGTAPAPPPSESAAEAGLTREAAADLLNSVPGLSSASVGSVISGLSTEVVVEVYVDEEAAILAEGVLDYVLRVGWATAVSDEPGILSLTVRSNGTTLDLQAQAIELTGAANLESARPHSVYLDEPGAYLGAWPGEVPTPPAG